MKNANAFLLGLALVFLLMTGLNVDVLAQALNDNGSTHTISANGSTRSTGSAQDYTIPANTVFNSISFTLKGGDGGYAKAGADCKSNGGEGALTTVQFWIGTGANELKPGGAIRFIVGKHGTNGDVGGTANTTAGGGGGTAVLYRPNSSSVWTILAVAGGGGGAHQGNVFGGCMDSQLGQGGQSTENGGNGGGSGAGTGGTGGNSGGGAGGSGGGAFSGNGGQAGYPDGGNGDTSFPLDGGWGFGAGGAGGGGGGGYSGGGYGSLDDNGGGGGSFVQSWAFSSTKTAGSNGGGNSQEGYVDYTFTDIEIVWTGAVSSDWNNSGNWNPARVPRSTDVVSIYDEPNDPQITNGVTANARVVRVFGSGNLTIFVNGALNLHPARSSNGIYNEGTITNNGGDIAISPLSGQPNFYGIRNKGTCINMLGGAINIDGMNSHGIWNNAGGSFSNQSGGTVIIGSASSPIGDNGIHNEAGGTFSNIGNLVAMHTNSTGIHNLGTFNNNSNGNLSISQAGGKGLLHEAGSFSNQGTLIIGVTGSTGLDNRASFNNDGGTVNIGSENAQIGQDGIWNQAGSSFTNTGTINIWNTSNIGLLNQNNFYNNSPGSIFIDQTGSVGLGHLGGLFENSGTITIGSIAAIQLRGIENQADFDNLSGGIINIDQANTGLWNTQLGDFLNEGLIKIGENGILSGNAVMNDGIFFNSFCKSAIHVFDKAIVDPADDFTNSGFILQESAAASNIAVNTGIIMYNAGTFAVDSGASPIAITQNSSDVKLWKSCVDSNNWDVATHWYPEGTPTASDAVAIYPGIPSPTIRRTTTAEVLTLTLESGVTLANNGSLSIANGDLDIGSGVTVGGNGQYDINGDFSINGGIFIPATSTVTLSGTANSIVGNDAVSFYNLVIDKSASASVDMVSDVAVINELSINLGDLTVQNMLTCPHLYLPNETDLTNEGSIITFGSATSGGAFWIQSGASAQGNGQYTLEGNFVKEGAFTPGTSTVTLSSTAKNQSISPNSVDFYNLLIDKPVDKKVIIGPAVTVANDFTLTSGDLELLNGSSLTCTELPLESGSDLTNDGTLTLTDGSFWIKSGASAQVDGQYTLNNNFLLSSGGTFTPGTSTVTMTGTGNSGIGNTSLSFYNLVIDKPSFYKITLNFNVTVTNSLLINSGDLNVNNTLTCPQLTLESGIDLTNNGSLILNSGSLNIKSGAKAQGDGQYSINGGFINSGTFTPGTSTVTLTSSGSFHAITGSNTFYNLTINKPWGYLSLAANQTISNELSMVSGNINLNGFDITLTDNGALIGESADSYIYGSGGLVKKTIDLNAPSAVNPGNLGVSITSSSDLGLTTIQRGHTAQQDIYGEVSILRYYDISPANNSGLDATVRFSYLDHELNGSVEANLFPYRFDGTNWEVHLVSARDASANWVETENVDAFSKWTLVPDCQQMTFYADMDGDGFGNPAVTTIACSPPDGFTDDNTDCNDNDADEFPNQVWYSDLDADGVSSGLMRQQCERPTGYFTSEELTVLTGDNCPFVFNPDQTDTDNAGIGDACDCDPDDAESEYLLIIGSGDLATGAYSANWDLESTATIAVSADITLTAGRSIRLLPGFTAQPGSNFHAYIDSCETLETSPAVLPIVVLPNTITPAAREATEPIRLEVWPNPVSQEANIRFELPEDGNVGLLLYDLYGRRIARLYDHQSLTAGIHEQRLNVEDLAPGVYLLRLVQSNRQRTVRIVVQNGL